MFFIPTVLNLILLCCIFLFSSIENIYSSELSYGNIENVEFLHNYDGDTFTVDILDFPNIIGSKIEIRINGIDTPEMKGKCEKEKEIALKAKIYLNSILKTAKNISLVNVKRDKYFRILADVYVDNIKVSDLLLEQNLAVPYDGGTKTTDWCK